ncbi:phosphogluconate dehydratase [Cupriavidus plantarum]|uniref:Phosphogluconate dehydratase n=1 Tax=Cupriavidus plantarum TaxID=942865 RepID=A0A316F2Y3_9BURK|nr:phosphogluconate dehydratase [Cupriavidus plantarum]PWK37913.1 6-phosphogluconate dehydratase [Cupriavidus plantarum]REF01388.1 6-phosphogluconate dehydratase [Cupriavidus plantarum]CAG2127893.1 Phosphogluconate dehydratase [Cupriavidus plantarum]SMR66929.1 6-phosphogluconate dehydratase [Cupriavidus plantarum]
MPHDSQGANVVGEVAAVTERVIARSRASRAAYLARCERTQQELGPLRGMSCANLAHGYAALPANDKLRLRVDHAPNLGIVTAYNDMLSAHQPYERYPSVIREAARAVGAVAQVAGGVPAMCDGITQGNAGMELSLFSRDAIAMGTAVALSHNTFDAAVMLGVCDKIVPGLLMGALQFGHLPVVFVPAGPMASGLPNKEKARVRQLYATGQVGRDALLEAECAAYHGAGTCTFYGTANSNQFLMEIMGLHMPGAAFIHPDSGLRDALTVAAAQRALALTARGNAYTPLARIVDERAVVNAMIGLLATGGSTNHTIHLVAMARSAGIVIDWNDFDRLSRITPLLARVYPNGSADVNHFHAAGGVAYVIAQLLDARLLHEDVETVAGRGLARYAQEPVMTDGKLTWRDGPAESGDKTVLAPASAPFSHEGGLRLMAGNLGRGVIKVSAVAEEHRLIEAPARVFESQEALQAAFEADELNRDVVAVVRFQGPNANGMPELHRLTPALGALQDAGHRVALVTDGRMSGASGKVPAVIHVGPEALAGGPLARVRDGDLIRVDAVAGTLELIGDDETLAEFDAREPAVAPADDFARFSLGRGLFGLFRRHARTAEEGGSAMDLSEADAAQTAPAVAQ